MKVLLFDVRCCPAMFVVFIRKLDAILYSTLSIQNYNFQIYHTPTGGEFVSFMNLYISGMREVVLYVSLSSASHNASKCEIVARRCVGEIIPGPMKCEALVAI